MAKQWYRNPMNNERVYGNPPPGAEILPESGSSSLSTRPPEDKWDSGYEYNQGQPGAGMGGWQDASGSGGIGAGMQNMWWGSDMNALKHGGKDLRATAMQWVPQLLESTPEAQTLFNEEEYMGMIRPQVEAAVGQMMGGYRTSMENIRRGMASRGISSSGLSQRLAGEQSGQMLSKSAGMEAQMMNAAKMQRLNNALSYRKDALALGLGVGQPGHQTQKDEDGDAWGSMAGSLGGSLFGGVGSGLGEKLGSMWD